MDNLALILHEAKLEIRAGFRSGIVTLTFWGLVLYLLMCLTNAEYMQQMGAADVPRNAATLIYMMGTGCMFFQFFAWAWLFAQPVLRDRKASLHEVVLTTPNSLSALLWGRFLGAAVVGAILSGAAILGFVFAPGLVWLDLAPAAAIEPTPWGILAYAWLWLQIPVSLGVGALYFLAALRTRSIAGPFALAAITLLLWMIAIVVLQGGGISPETATIIDPSLFTFVYDQNQLWTPAQKTSSLLPFTWPSLVNRLIWCVLPVIVLAISLSRITRESLVLAKSPKRAPQPELHRAVVAMAGEAAAAVPAVPSLGRSLGQLASETWWRIKQITSGRGWWGAVALLILMGVVSSFIHVVWHADGPMSPTIELLLPLLKDSLFLYVAFVVAAMAGIVYRRDDVEGFRDIMAATPVPSYVQALSCALAVAIMTVLMAMVPGIAGAIVVLLSGAGGLPLPSALMYQLLVVAPPMLEIAMIAFIVHALIRRSGLAYAASMLITFFLILNHELELVQYPPLEVGIAAHIQLSALDGWAPWLDYLLALDGYKLALAGLLAAIGGLFMPRGHDSRLARGLAAIRSRLTGPVGGLLAVAVVALVVLGGTLHKGLVEQGGYQSATEAQAEDAAWETEALPKAFGYEVAGGDLSLVVDSRQRLARGTWQLDQVMTTGPKLMFEVPHGFQLGKAQVNGAAVTAKIQHGLLEVPLDGCGQPSCQVRLSWLQPLAGWDAEGHAARLGPEGIWLRAADLAPRLGLDPERLVRFPAHRDNLGLPKAVAKIDPNAAAAMAGLAPSGQWRWQVKVDDGQETVLAKDGRIEGALDFALFWSPSHQFKEIDDLSFRYNASHEGRVEAIARDVTQMRDCVHKRLGGYVPITQVTVWPRRLGSTKVNGELLQLAEYPHWDVADQGTGRWLRRVAIGQAMASSYISSRTGLRRVPGAVWLHQGVSGAVGLLCLAQLDGIEALSQVLSRFADRTNRDLSIAYAPVTTLAAAPLTGWAEHYAPMATLGWALEQTPASYDALFTRIAAGEAIGIALIAVQNEAVASLLLGAPKGSTIEEKVGEPGALKIVGERAIWQEGGWHKLAEPVRYRALIADKGRGVGLIPATEPLSPGTKALLLDDWPSFPRDPKLNLVGGSPAKEPASE